MSAEELLGPMDALRLASDTESLGEVRSQLGMLVLGVARGDPPVVFGGQPKAAGRAGWPGAIHLGRRYGARGDNPGKARDPDRRGSAPAERDRPAHGRRQRGWRSIRGRC